MIQRLRRRAILLLALVLIGGAYTVYADQRTRTPEAALMQILHAVRTEDRQLFDTYVDEDAVLTSLHTDVSTLLVDNIDALHARHPADWFFRHDSAFMKNYMEQHRTEHLDAARAALDFYFDTQRVPVTKTDGNARWGSDEVHAFVAHYTASLESPVITGDRAMVNVIVRGDDTDYGRLLPEGSVTMELAQQTDGRWKLVGVHTDTARTNGFYALIDAAERYWEFQGWD